ncbi:hypothetical protein [Bradyrhizobium sp. SYSU BS000235]|uniref:hypothetical protein n=1 Tax=Bradyrhizobium sp. SYSU BS000235 TaxID=3411332 RepID=UPI003C7381BC
MSHVSSLSRSHRAALVAATLILGSAAPALAADNGARSNIVLADRHAQGAAENREAASVTHSRNESIARRLSAQKPWPAPVGHRQPRISDIPASAQLSSAELDEQRQDRELNAKLIICRGC